MRGRGGGSTRGRASVKASGVSAGRALAQAALLFLAVAGTASGQTVEPRYDPYATGAATIIYPDEAALGAQNLVDLLQWHVPGALVSRCPNNVVKVTFRGGHTTLRDSVCETPPKNPLLIIDGAKVPNDDFSWQLLSLNPFRVERVEVLRDLGSTAIYGIRANRGVILVFTRRR